MQRVYKLRCRRKRRRVERQKLKPEEEGEGTPASYKHRAFRITATDFDAIRFHQLLITDIKFTN